MNIEKGKKLKYWNGVETETVECVTAPTMRGGMMQVEVRARRWVTLDSIKGSAEEVGERNRRQNVSTRPAARDERSESKRDRGEA